MRCTSSEIAIRVLKGKQRHGHSGLKKDEADDDEDEPGSKDSMTGEEEEGDGVEMTDMSRSSSIFESSNASGV